MKLFPAAIISFLLLLPPAVRADIYRWEDDSGTVHFTDDLSNIPAANRGKAEAIIREAPPGQAPPPSISSDRVTGQPPSPAYQAPTPGEAVGNPARERDALASEVEQLKAKISAKETLIKTVEDRQNLALNPLRARVVDAADLELYKKYQAELPQDRERLQELESRLQLLK